MTSTLMRCTLLSASGRGRKTYHSTRILFHDAFAAHTTIARFNTLRHPGVHTRRVRTHAGLYYQPGRLLPPSATRTTYCRLSPVYLPHLHFIPLFICTLPATRHVHAQPFIYHYRFCAPITAPRALTHANTHLRAHALSRTATAFYRTAPCPPLNAAFHLLPSPSVRTRCWRTRLGFENDGTARCAQLVDGGKRGTRGRQRARSTLRAQHASVLPRAANLSLSRQRSVL